ncbi:MAG: FmdB family zinc ribbon protein [Nitrospiraceae bacterium]
MPIYEYRCSDCGKRNSLLILNARNPAPPVCRYCHSAKLERLMSKFSAPKSEDARLDAMTDPSKFGDMDENDPQSMARFMRKMGREMGEDLGDNFEQALEEAGDGAAESDLSDMD